MTLGFGLMTTLDDTSNTSVTLDAPPETLLIRQLSRAEKEVYPLIAAMGIFVYSRHL